MTRRETPGSQRPSKAPPGGQAGGRPAGSSREPDTTVRISRSEIRIFLLAGIIIGMIIIAVMVTAVYREQFTVQFLSGEGIGMLESGRTYGGAVLDGEVLRDTDPATGRIRLTAIYSATEPLQPQRLASFCQTTAYGSAWTMTECAIIDGDPDSYRIVLVRNN